MGVHHDAWQVEIADNPMQLIRRIYLFPTTPHQLSCTFIVSNVDTLIGPTVSDDLRLPMQRVS